MAKRFSHKTVQYRNKPYIVLGWRERVSLPEFGIEVNAKIDTGARTSALHAFAISRFRHNNKDKVSFVIHPNQRDNHTIINCEANLVDIRYVTDSGAHRELRFVIETIMVLGEVDHTIEISLTNRAEMTYRMLLGRNALKHHYIVDPTRSYYTEKIKEQEK